MEAKDEQTEEGAVHVMRGEGHSMWIFGELVMYKVTAERTGGAYSLFEVTTQPGAGPPPHVQHREDESFYVLEGEYEFLVEEGTIRAGAGGLLYVPKGTLHAHKNVGTGVGTMLITQTPGGLCEHFFEEVGMAVDHETGSLFFEDQRDVGRIVKVAAEYGIEIPSPIV